MKGGENTLEKIEEAIDYVYGQLPSDDSYVLSEKCFTAMERGDMASQEQEKCGTFGPLQVPPTPLLKNSSGIPSELITQCVATLLMIQVRKVVKSLIPPKQNQF